MVQLKARKEPFALIIIVFILTASTTDYVHMLTLQLLPLVTTAAAIANGFCVLWAGLA